MRERKREKERERKSARERKRERQVTREEIIMEGVKVDEGENDRERNRETGNSERG